MKRRKRTKMYLYTMLAAVLISIFSSVNVFASEHVISSVSIRVYSRLEAGDTLPGIDIADSADSDGTVAVYANSSRFTIGDAEWVTSTSKEMKVGSTPEMKLTLYAEDDYYFKGSYRSSNVSVKSGEFVSAKRRNEDELEVRLRVKPISGTYEAPEDAYWKNNTRGTARWERADTNDSGMYEVMLKRGSSTVTTVQTTSRTYDFYPYMTVKGTYSFKVRAIPRTSGGEKYGKKSEWTESDEIYIAAEDVSDGRGQNIGQNQPVNSNPYAAGWIQSSGAWYYRFPDGKYASNCWQAVGGKWYLFGQDGRMLTGWQKWKDHYYLLAGSGEMLTGWQMYNNRWYYLNPTKDQFEGCMFAGTMYTIGGNTYYFNSDGSRAEGWVTVNGNTYYFAPGTGIMARNRVIDTFYVDSNGIWRRE